MATAGTVFKQAREVWLGCKPGQEFPYDNERLTPAFREVWANLGRILSRYDSDKVKRIRHDLITSEYGTDSDGLVQLTPPEDVIQVNAVYQSTGPPGGWSEIPASETGFPSTPQRTLDQSTPRWAFQSGSLIVYGIDPGVTLRINYVGGLGPIPDGADLTDATINQVLGVDFPLGQASTMVDYLAAALAEHVYTFVSHNAEMAAACRYRKEEKLNDIIAIEINARQGQPARRQPFYYRGARNRLTGQKLVVQVN